MPKKLIIIIGVIVLLAGGALGTMSQLEIGPFSAKEDVDKSATVAAEDRPPDPPRFVAMDVLLVPLFTGDRVSGTVQITVQLETSPKKEDELKKLVPVLKDAFIRDLNGYIPRLIRTKGQIDVNLVKQRLKIIGDRAIGKGILDGVLIQSVLNRAGR